MIRWDELPGFCFTVCLMRIFLRNGFGLALAIAMTGSAVLGQENQPARSVNFGYSQNPKTKVKKDSDAVAPTVEPTNSEGKTETESIAKKTLDVVRRSNRAAVAPTETYRVGIGDVLFINLQNASKGSSYFTVLNDGTIDYPLAGEMIQVAGMMTDEIEDILRERIKLFENPQVSVKVRDYASHKITVLGLVERSGERFIQREAMPLFVVRAEAIVKPNATKAVIKRTDAKTETVDLRNGANDSILVFPGDIVEFTSDELPRTGAANAFIYISGEVAAVGRREFHEGMTLTQAIIEAGGLKKEGVKKATLRRRNAEGLLVSTEYNLKSIRDGKAADPLIAAGDMIEIGN